jgi:HK97 family phage prohead protease
MPRKAKNIEFSTKEFNVYFPFSQKAVIDCPACGGSPCSCAEPTGKVLKIEGYANFCGDMNDEASIFVDHCGDVMVPSGFDLTVWKKNPQILWQHDRNYTIGKGLTATKKADGLQITAEIHEGSMEEEDFYKVEHGLVSMLSVGFRTQAGEFREVNKQQVFFITKALLYEVSVVSIPMNAESGFNLIKSLDGSEGFYATSSEFNPKALHGAEHTSNHEAGDEKMKLKFRDLLPEDKVKELETLGLTEDLDALKEIDSKTFFEALITKALDSFKTEVLAAVDEKIKASVPAEIPAGEGAEEEKGAEQEEEKAADKTEDETKEVDAESVKTLTDMIANLKARLADEK